MKIKLKKFKSISLYILIPITLVLVLIFLIYQSNQKIKLLKQGIDLKPRPFSELIALDFADVKDEPADPSKCDGTKIMKFLSEVKTSTAQVSWFKDYDPNIHKLTILDNCWRQYENEYVKFKFRDLNGSLWMDRENSFNVTVEGLPNNIGIYDNSKNGKTYFNAVLRLIPLNSEFLGMSTYKNKNDEIILRTEILSHSPVHLKRNIYTIELPNTDKFIFVSGYTDRTIMDILSTIELKK